MLVDRGLERWRSHDAAAERQKRADMAREGHTHRETRTTDSSKQTLRPAEVEKRSRDETRAGKRVWRGAEAGGQHKGLERRTSTAARLLLA